MEQPIEQDFYFKEALFKMFNVRQTRKLIEVLNNNGIRFFTTGHGDPFVPRTEFERKPTIKKTSPPEKIKWQSNVLKT